jgi:hypothetical protein
MVDFILVFQANYLSAILREKNGNLTLTRVTQNNKNYQEDPRKCIFIFITLKCEPYQMNML